MNRNPVLLIHGIFRKQTVFNTMYAYLTQKGREVHRFDLTPNNATQRLETLAEQIVYYVNNNFPPSQPIDLVGLSMGGLVSRYYVQRLGGIERVQRFVTISSPHNGTLMAYFLPLTACIQMRPGSEFLQELNQDAKMLEEIKFTSIWSPYDFIIVPGHSSKLGIGREIQLSVSPHFRMAVHLSSLEAVANALEG